MSGTDTNQDILGAFISNLQTMCNELKGHAYNKQNEYFDGQEFWNNLVGATKLVSHDATKFGMLFSKKPHPSPPECRSIVESMETKCVTLLMVLFSLPKSQGKTLHRELQLFALTILEAVSEMCLDAKQNSSNQLQLVGTVWSKCEAVSKLPRDNKSAVICIIQEQLGTVQDALQEIQTNIESEHEEIDEFLVPPNGMQPLESDKWSDADHQLLPSCLGLIKVVKACLKKTKTAMSNHSLEENEAIITQLDEVSEICKSSSSLVDDFVLSLYPPVNHSVVKDQASSVVEHLRKLLSVVKESQFCTPADEEWIMFLRTAITHNWEKVTDRVLED